MAEAVFTQERAQAVLESAGHPSADLLSFGENAVFAAGRLVIKVGRGADLLDRARREVRTADWLAKHDVPAVRSAESEVRLVDGHPITYWQRLPESLRPAEPADVAPLLRLVHALPEPDFGLPPRDLLGGSSAGCGWRVTRSTRPTRRSCGRAGTGWPRRSPNWCRTCRAARSTATHSPATSTSARTGRSWWTWRPSPPTCASTTSSCRPSAATATGCRRPRIRPSPPPTAGTSREWEGCDVLRGARETAGCAWVAQHAAANPAALQRVPAPGGVAALRRHDGALVLLLTDRLLQLQGGRPVFAAPPSAVCGTSMPR